MKILNVAEKNDAARGISTILSNGASQRREGYSKYNKIYTFEYNALGDANAKMIFTSVTGHLLNCEFAQEFRKWGAVQPLELFDAPVSKFCPVNSEPIKRTLEREARNCQALIIWTDCDREGENIGFEVIQVCRTVNPRLDVYRARFSEITRGAVTRAMRTLAVPDRNVSAAVDCRSELDLRIGAAFTRFQTLRLQRRFAQLSQKLISYGSCQFPTLGFVVERYLAVQNFIAEPFWKLKVSHTKAGLRTDFAWRRVHLFDEDACTIIHERCLDDPEAVVRQVARKPKSKWRPLPLDTVELEKSASRKLRINAKETMKIAEKLYNKGFISYPRTETNFFPKDINLVQLVHEQAPSPQWGQFATAVLHQPGGPNPRAGNKSDQAHPPIHPLKYTDELAGNEKRIYEFIVRHFLACVSRDALGEETTVEIEIAEEQFHASGLVILERNYLEVYHYDRWNAKTIGQYVQDERFQPDAIEMVGGQTAAPPLLTEADLISLMEKHGIGTDATHAEHIETIKERLYVGVNDQNRFEPGFIGLGLVQGYDAMGYAMSKPNLRAELEADLQRICEGRRAKADVLREQIDKYRDIFQVAMARVSCLDDAMGQYFGRNGGPPAGGGPRPNPRGGPGGGNNPRPPAPPGPAGQPPQRQPPPAAGPSNPPAATRPPAPTRSNPPGQPPPRPGPSSNPPANPRRRLQSDAESDQENNDDQDDFRGGAIRANNNQPQRAVIPGGIQQQRPFPVIAPAPQRRLSVPILPLTTRIYPDPQPIIRATSTTSTANSTDARQSLENDDDEITDEMLANFDYENLEEMAVQTALDTVGQTRAGATTLLDDNDSPEEDTSNRACYRCPKCGDLMNLRKSVGGSFALVCRRALTCGASMQLPSPGVLGALVLDQECVEYECRGINLTELQFQPSAFPAAKAVPLGYTGCLFCDVDLIEWLDLEAEARRILESVIAQTSSSRAGNSPRKAPRVKRQRSAAGASANGGTRKAPVKANTNTAPAVKAKTSPYFNNKRPAGWGTGVVHVPPPEPDDYNFDDDDPDSTRPPPPQCRCGLPAKELTVRKEGPNTGRVFFTCPTGRDNGGCNFFQWAGEGTAGATASRGGGQQRRPAARGNGRYNQATTDNYDNNGGRRRQRFRGGVRGTGRKRQRFTRGRGRSARGSQRSQSPDVDLFGDDDVGDSFQDDAEENENNEDYFAGGQQASGSAKRGRGARTRRGGRVAGQAPAPGRKCACCQRYGHIAQFCPIKETEYDM